jgi:hypothetical protein
MRVFTRKWKIWYFLSLMIFALSAWSCKDALNADDYKLKKATANPILNLPIASGDLVINDFLSKVDQANIKVYSDGLVYLLYEQTLKSQGIRDLFDFPSKSFTKTVPVPPATLPSRSTEIQYATLNTTEDFAFNPEKLSEIKFKTTSVRVTVTFSPAAPASSVFEVQLKLPNFQLNGVPFQKRITLGVATAVFPLQDYIATLANNTFPMEIAIFEKPHASSVAIANPTSASIKIDFTTIDFQYLKGFFGDQTAINIPAETINLDAFGTSLTKANVSFAQPKLSFRVSNDFGIPTKITFGSLEARKNNGTKLPVTLSPLSPLDIVSAPALGQSAITDVSVTNAKQLIDFVPDQFYYKLSARINQNLTSGTNFCADTSKIRVTFKAEIPLYGKASGIVLADTFAIDLSKAKDTNVESGAIRSKINNQLPLDAFLQLYIADANSIIIDSLFTTAQTAIVKASSVNTQGELVTAGTTDSEAIIPIEKLNKLFDAKKMIVKVKMNTAKDASGASIDVKFKSSYKMNVIFGLKAKLKLAIDL